MPQNRIFLPQEALDAWLAEGRADIDGETLTVKADGSKYGVKTAVRFMAEMAGGGDGKQLVGKVKDLEQVGALGGEHVSDSVILGDDAYQVVEGFVCEPILDEADMVSGSSLASAAAAAAGEATPQPGEIDLLTRFFLQSR